ncbi:MAG TPA: 5-oxoprolinase subunit PxpB [Candidatus Dormibacteraeota bacterium]|jgi:inhibitor of KinA|nr:5-oxoprolinase subunit PxpB [Candidatus Dormibacteraeota bacterium]
MTPHLRENFRFQAASDQSLLVYFGEKISIETHRRIVRFLKLLEAKRLNALQNIHPAYCSVLVKFDALKFTHSEIESLLTPYLARLEDVKLSEPRVRKIPVCYGGEFGPDIVEVASLRKIAVEEVIRLHSSAEYTVYFLGFVPGFAYLGGLPEQLTTPRLDVPQKKVPAGSVAIGGGQTGVYPVSTPGGWRLIGQTPLKLFRPDAQEQSFLAIGDEVRFEPITKEKFAELAEA